MADSCPHKVQSLTFQPREAQQAPPQGDASAEVFSDSVFFLDPSRERCSLCLPLCLMATAAPIKCNARKS